MTRAKTYISRQRAIEFAFWMMKQPSLPNAKMVSGFFNSSMDLAYYWRRSYLAARHHWLFGDFNSMAGRGIRLSAQRAIEFAFWMMKQQPLPNAKKISGFLNISLDSAYYWRKAYLNARQPIITTTQETKP
jgi:hypothetical protein